MDLLSPIAGLNAKTSLAEMRSREAIRLDNWVCRTDGLHVRAGYSVQSSGLGASPVALMRWYGSSNDTIFATTATGLWNVTSAIATFVLPMQSGYVSSAIHTNAGRAVLVAVNGRDGLLTYNGAQWSLSGVTGCDASQWHSVCVHHNHLFAADDARVWYLEQGAIMGPAHPAIPATLNIKTGGRIAGIASLQPTGGKSSDNLLCIAISGGELIVYAGNNPRSKDSWSLQGVYRIPPPVTRNCFIEHGDMLHLVTRDGILPVPSILPADPAKKPTGATTNDVKNLWDLAYGTNDLAGLLGDYNGLNSGAGRFDLIRVPGAGTWVRPPETDGWSMLTDLGATCWLDDGEHLHFGRNNGTVCRYGGQDDNGASIQALMVGAFQNMKGQHQFSRARLNFDRSGSYKPLFRVMTNYQNVPAGIVGANVNASYYTWPAVAWPMVSAPDVPGRTRAQDLWRGLSGRGHVAAPILAVKTMAPLIYYGAEIEGA